MNLSGLFNLLFSSGNGDVITFAAKRAFSQFVQFKDANEAFCVLRCLKVCAKKKKKAEKICED